MRTGHQCGMLWGSSLAASAEVFRRTNGGSNSIAIAITISKFLAESFINRARSLNCREIIGFDLSKNTDMLKYMLKYIFLFDRKCVNLAERWIPEAIQSVVNNIDSKNYESGKDAVSCASEMAKQMGASDEEIVMVSGFAGGFGLTGNACGALSAAVWLNNLSWCKKHPKKTPPFFKNQIAKEIIKIFKHKTNSEIVCRKICGISFRTIDEHTEFIKNSGCADLINLLATAKMDNSSK
jgi:hypothetical protein